MKCFGLHSDFFLTVNPCVPIAFAMGAGSALAIFITGVTDPVLITHKMFTSINSFSLMAIPFFMLAGELMDCGGISKRLVNLAHTCVGHITGGLGIVDILTSVLFCRSIRLGGGRYGCLRIDIDSSHEKAGLSRRPCIRYSGMRRLSGTDHSAVDDDDHILFTDEYLYR